MTLDRTPPDILARARWPQSKGLRVFPADHPATPGAPPRTTNGPTTTGSGA